VVQDIIIIRKNVRSLSSTEKKDFIQAVEALKANAKDAKISDNRYDDYVLMHAKTMSIAAGTDADYNMRNLAHRGPVFLPWHREYLRRFEVELRNAVPGVAIPYWDWTEDAYLDDPKESPVWSIDFMGGNGDPKDNNIVKTGPFKDWLTVEANQHGDPIGKSRLKRTFGVEIPKLPTQTDVYDAFKFDFYDTPYWDARSRGFRNALEGFPNGPQLHNRVHVWVGGSMLLNTSPNDPVFFLNHCNVDRIWAHWQAIRSDQGYPLNIKDRNCMPIKGLNVNDDMFPWKDLSDTSTVASVLDHRKLQYTYDK
jgi:tyrosinase